MKSICILSSLYPNAVYPAGQVFVQQFVWAMADLGIECTVISPVAVNLNPMVARLPNCVTETTTNGAKVKVYFPKFISFGQRNLLGVKTARFTTESFYDAIHNVWKKLNPRPEVIYGHFLTPAGICASRISRKYNVPSFAAYGESSPWSIFNYGEEKMKTEIGNLNGIVAVSSASQQDLEKVNVFPITKVRVFPNGIRLNHFYPRDKTLARAKFGFDQDSFIVSFLGQFCERKGVLRVAEAVKGLENVKVAFAGDGFQQPNVANCAYKGLVKPADVPDFLSASDVFVLPTLGEGCCNAILEAMACGLPVISSNLPFNADILNYENAILVDPNNVQEIRSAIIKMRDNPEKSKTMGEASLSMARNLTIESRAKNIYDWIREMA
ncbi:glycosyltransferase family 4 protein [Adhaeribacter soli]|uniref:Glycosyltransferase family 4 protein n=1 Tax=Adhaeribacter soli TaxID=2607655 RepID=A0A5N1J3P6_9BACT|nr:glycosyltransferase family 4 protein [Adhaeribacter soli]KAA9340715.1 glycosyltransferase family 4 protein [Adhaeribacter soli]